MQTSSDLFPGKWVVWGYSIGSVQDYHSWTFLLCESIKPYNLRFKWSKCIDLLCNTEFFP